MAVDEQDCCLQVVDDLPDLQIVLKDSLASGEHIRGFVHQKDDNQSVEGMELLVALHRVFDCTPLLNWYRAM